MICTDFFVTPINQLYILKLPSFAFHFGLDYLLAHQLDPLFLIKYRFLLPMHFTRPSILAGFLESYFKHSFPCSWMEFPLGFIIITIAVNSYTP